MEALKGVLLAYVAYALDCPNHYRMWFDTGKLREEGGLLRMSHDHLEYVVFQTWLDCIAACQAAGQLPGEVPGGGRWLEVENGLPERICH